MPCAPIATTQNNRNGCHDTGQGFTLLEILVSLSILASIIFLIFGTFEGVFSGADHINAVSGLYEAGDAAINRMTMDLQALHISLKPRYHIPDIDDDPEIYRLEGTQDSRSQERFAMLRFTSLAHLPLNQDQRRGIARIVYYVDSDGENGFVLRRADDLFPYPDFEPSAADPVVCEKLRSFELVYHSPQGDEKDNWNSESDDFNYSTPTSIGIKLILGDEQTAVEFNTEVALPLQRVVETGR